MFVEGCGCEYFARLCVERAFSFAMEHSTDLRFGMVKKGWKHLQLIDVLREKKQEIVDLVKENKKKEVEESSMGADDED